MLMLILAGYLMIVLDIAIAITALPEIHTSLGFSDTGLSWVQNAYMLAFGGLLLLGARSGDILGRRRMFIVGIALFTVASLGVALVLSAVWLVAARALQGVGGAILAPSTLALLTANFPEGRERTRAVAYYGAVAGVGASLGLVLGGSLGLGILVTVFATAGSATMDPPALLAVRVASSLTAGTVMLALALIIVVVLIVRLQDVVRVPGTTRRST
jgi:MFS family permease